MVTVHRKGAKSAEFTLFLLPAETAVMFSGRQPQSKKAVLITSILVLLLSVTNFHRRKGRDSFLLPAPAPLNAKPICNSSAHRARNIPERRPTAISTELMAYIAKALEAEVKGCSLPAELLRLFIWGLTGKRKKSHLCVLCDSAVNLITGQTISRNILSLSR